MKLQQMACSTLALVSSPVYKEGEAKGEMGACGHLVFSPYVQPLAGREASLKWVPRF